MANDGLDWEGLLKWSLAHSDGTKPSRNLSEEDRKWFMEAMQAQTVDVMKRMKEITLVMKTPEDVLQAQGVTPENIEDMLDELQEHVESIDMANALIRDNKQGIAAFHLANGYAALKDALGSDDVRFQRKALNLIQYLQRENSSDNKLLTELGFPRLMMNLASSDDPTVREASLRGLLELARDTKSGGSEGTFPEADEQKLRQVLEGRIAEIREMARDDLEAAREERQLVDSLWSACYNEPSSLRANGLLVLPGEETSQPPPDVAGKLFEPAMRALAAASSSTEEKQQKPLLLGPPNNGGNSSS